VAVDLLRDLVERRGVSLVIWPRGADRKDWKGPRDTAWTSKDYPLTDNREGMNFGAKLGTEVQPGRYLADVDFDNVTGGIRADRFLPANGFVFGRASKPMAHVFYTTPTPVVLRQYKDPIKRTEVVVELRGLTKKGTPCQTMIPPSLHPSNETLCVVSEGEFEHVDNLERRVALFAVTDRLYKYLGHRGFGHDARMAVAGLLLQSGATNEEALDVCQTLAEATGNDAKDAAVVIETTAKAIAAGEPVKGQTALAEMIDPKVVKRLSEWLGAGETDDENTIVVAGGKLTEIVDRVEAKLLESDQPIYQRGGKLVMPVRQELEQDHGGVKRERGSLVLSQLREARLTELMGGVMRWKSNHKPIDPPSIYPRTLLARDDWKFPSLRAVVTAPLLRRDGSVLDTPGYDAQTRLLLDFDLNAFPRVPTAPTKDDAAAALDRLNCLLRGFPFDGDSARSVALAAMLTALVRPVMRTAPLFAFDAPTAGTGKSMLVELAGLIATGVKPPALSQGKTPEENEKRLVAVLRAGDPIIHLDNCERPVEGDFLCSMLTQEVVQSRILGLSEVVVLPATALVMASGNNLTLPGDVTRRAVICRLDAKVERPADREFDFDCHAEALVQRPELVVAGLTVLRAYTLAGPVKLKKPMGSFADFALIRGALVWLGHADPAETQEAIFDADPRRDELQDVMALWAAALGDASIEVAEIDKAASAFATSYAQIKARPAIVELHDKLIEAGCQGRGWSGRSVGWWLRRHKDRVSNGRAFRCEPSRNGQKWTLSNGEPRQKDLSDSDWTDEVPDLVTEEGR
jgi:hypothetical protein